MISVLYKKIERVAVLHNASKDLIEMIRKNRKEAEILNKKNQRELAKRNKTAQKPVKTPAQGAVNTPATNQKEAKNYSIDEIKAKLREKGRLEINGYGYKFKQFSDLIELAKVPDEPVIHIEPFVQSGGYGVFQDLNQKSLKIVGGSGLVNCEYMFAYCKASTLDLSDFDRSNLMSMFHMFERCKVPTLDLSSFDTSKVTNMRQMFYDCEVSTLNLSSFNTSNVTDMRSMFSGCKASTLDLSNLDISKVTNMEGMFDNCKISTLNISNVSSTSRFSEDMFTNAKIDNLIIDKNVKFAPTEYSGVL